MKNEEIKFFVETELRDRFMKAVEQNQKSIDQVLSELMTEYVDRTQTNLPGISSDERIRRGKALAFAQASVELEGFKVTEEYKIQAQRFINGEIEFEDLTKSVHEQIKNG